MCLYFFALLCAGCAVSSVRSASDDYLEITRRNGWGVLVSERLLKSINSDPDLPQICKDDAVATFSSSNVERIYVEWLSRYFSPLEAAEFVAFLRTSAGAKFVTQDFGSAILTDEETRIVNAFGRSSASVSFEKFAADQTLLRDHFKLKGKSAGRKCATMLLEAE